jgi:hypothetical protein
MTELFKKGEISDHIEIDQIDDASIDSDILIEKIEGVLNNNNDRNNEDESKNENNDEVHRKPKHSVDGFVDRFFIESYDLVLYKVYQVFNLLMSLALLIIFLFVRSSWTLALFMAGILVLHVPLGLHYLSDYSKAEQLESRSINNTYFIQTGVYYLVLSIYSVIMNAYYGDSIGELVNLLIFSNMPTLLSITCFIVSTESIKYNRARKEVRDNLTDSGESNDETEDKDRIICSPEEGSISESDHAVCESDDTEETET